MKKHTYLKFSLVIISTVLSLVALANSPMSYLNKGYCISSPKNYSDVTFRSSDRSCYAHITMQRQITQEENESLSEFENAVESDWNSSGISDSDAETLYGLSAPTVGLPFLTTTYKVVADAVAGQTACSEVRVKVKQLYDTGRICK